MSKPLMEIKSASVVFPGAKKKSTGIGALVNINLNVGEGEIIAVVGESGCGKTTLGKMIVGIHKPTEGEVLYKGKNISKLKGKEFNEYRLGVQMVHQDSYAALNPNKTIYQSLSLPLFQHNIVKNHDEAIEVLTEYFHEVGLNPPEQFLEKYPHQLSGGQRQRILLARALSVKPKLIVADEPVSMVDVSLRISLLDLMTRMNKKYKISFVYITHDLGTARYIADHGRMVVMYLGRMIEVNQIHEAIRSPKHPYFHALISAVPEADPNTRSEHVQQLPLRTLDMPSLLNLPKGCKFHPRCLHYTEKCEKEEPVLREFEGGMVSCHHAEKILLQRKIQK
ncbi:Glutathione import ATP-binding protein GsiA [uncultured Clostridium sp.]|uniref:ABC transporter ATP-binding protein n=1 Tax=uncultured Clostridium sp. TaxID=59620 RepID=UPI00082107B6|nr:ABC transporter ATP-binding protein [uncultured Clostridium sp.]SCI84801.1 Glutathione import ATP-binding protein GsiA [uncultured Clostridium sp.]